MHYEALEQLTRDRRAARQREAETHRLATGTQAHGALRRTLAAGLERLHQRRRTAAGLRQHA